MPRLVSYSCARVSSSSHVCAPCPPQLGTVDEQSLVDFLVTEKNFQHDRVTKAIERLKKAMRKGSQSRLDSFFKPAAGGSFAPLKRKVEGKKANGALPKKAKGLVTKGKSKGVGRR